MSDSLTIQGMADAYKKLIADKDEQIERLQFLLLCAADALEEAEGALLSLKFSFQSSDLLIAELRKAAQ